MKNTWERFFNNFSVMVVYKRVYFGERPYKCSDCRDRFNCTPSLKIHYKMHKLQNKNGSANHQFVDNFPSSQKHKENKKQTIHKLNGFVQTYTGKFII